MNKKISKAKAKRDKRDAKICSLFDENIEDYKSVNNVMGLYLFISKKIGASKSTIIRVLKSNGYELRHKKTA